MGAAVLVFTRNWFKASDAGGIWMNTGAVAGQKVNVKMSDTRVSKRKKFPYINGTPDRDAWDYSSRVDQFDIPFHTIEPVERGTDREGSGLG